MRLRLGWLMPILVGVGAGLVPAALVWRPDGDVVVEIIQTAIFLAIAVLWVFNVRMYGRNAAMRATHVASFITARVLREAGVTQTQLTAAVDRVNAEARERAS